MHAYDFAYVGFSGGISTRASPASPGNLWHLSAEESQAEGSTEVGQWEACDKVLTYSYQVKMFCQFCQFFVKLCESLGNPVLHSIPEASFKHKSTSPGKSPATTYASKVHCGTMRNRFTASPLHRAPPVPSIPSEFGSVPSTVPLLLNSVMLRNQPRKPTA